MSRTVHDYLSRSADTHSDRLHWVALFLVLSILLHITLLKTTPDTLFETKSYLPRKDQSLSIELAPPPKPLPRYVEANPSVVDNVPDETDQQSYRNQQAAQPDADPNSQSSIPKLAEGTEAFSQKIVDGTLDEQPSVSAPSGIYTNQPSHAESVQSTQAPVVTQTPPPPLPDFIAQKPVSEDGPGSTLQETGEHTQKAPDAQPTTIKVFRSQKTVEIVEESVEEQVQQEAAARGMPIPKARPKLRFKVPPGPIVESPMYAGRMGVVSVDSVYSEYGEYQQRMVEAVSKQWHLLAGRSSLADGNTQTRVVLTFYLDEKGLVNDLKTEFSSASRQGTALCLDAVMSRAPYGDWTQAMKTAIGERLPIRFTFHYY